MTRKVYGGIKDMFENQKSILIGHDAMKYLIQILEAFSFFWGKYVWSL
jgi:hypothetical protein